MVNFVFVVDTSYVMSQKVPEYGLTLLELCKTAIHRAVNNRKKLVPKPADTGPTKFQHKYLLVTYSASAPIQCGWQHSADYFLRAVESLQAVDRPNLSGALCSALRLVQSNPNQSTTYAQGWQSWHCEMNIVLVLTYCMQQRQPHLHGSRVSRDQRLGLPVRAYEGDELEADWLQWNARVFIGNVSVLGTATIGHPNYDVRNHEHVDVRVKSVFDALCALSLETCPSEQTGTVVNQLHSLNLMERWVTTVMRDHGRDGVIVDFWDATNVAEFNKKYAATDSDDEKACKFHDGQLFRELIMPVSCAGKWPIPECFSPKEEREKYKLKLLPPQQQQQQQHTFPARPCRPQIALRRQDKNAMCVPRHEWNVPIEQYELTSNKLREFLLRSPPCIYYAYMNGSAGSKFDLAKPWGALKADHKRKKVFFYVFAYDFPFVWNQIGVFLGAQKREFHNFGHEEWKTNVAAYLGFIPSYYVPTVQELLQHATKGRYVPSASHFSLEPSFMAYLAQVKKKRQTFFQHAAQVTQPFGGANAGHDMEIKIDDDLDAMAMVSNDAMHVDDDEKLAIVPHESKIVEEQDDNDDEFHLCAFPFDSSDGETDSEERLGMEWNGYGDLLPAQAAAVMAAANKNITMPGTQQRGPNQRMAATNLSEKDVLDQRQKRRQQFHSNLKTSDFHRDVLPSTDTDMNALISNLTFSLFGDDDDDDDDEVEDDDGMDSSTVAVRRQVAQIQIRNTDVSDRRNSGNGVSDHRLILDQLEADRKHVEKHVNMGNYAMFTDRLKYKKDAFKSPFENEYSHYGLSLSFSFLQEKVTAERAQQQQSTKTKTNMARSYLETESRLKSSSLLSIHDILHIRKQTRDALWTKNEMCTKFFDDDNEAKIDANGGNESRSARMHSLLKSQDWLSAQVLHNLKPTNLGGNPFKKRRKKSPFPLVKKPKNGTSAAATKNSNPMSAAAAAAAALLNTTASSSALNRHQNTPFDKEKEQQNRFELELSALPHLSSFLSDGKPNQSRHHNKSSEQVSSLVGITPPPPPPPPPKKVKKSEESPPSSLAINTNITTITNDDAGTDTDTDTMTEIAAQSIKSQVPQLAKPSLPSRTPTVKVEDTPRRTQGVQRAIERAREQQFIKKRQILILPMKRRASNMQHSSVNESALKKIKRNGTIAPTNTNINVADRQNTSERMDDDDDDEDDDDDVPILNGSNMNGKCMPRSFGEQHVDRVISFMNKFCQRVRSQTIFDIRWLVQNVDVLNGLNSDLKLSFLKTMIEEAKNYNRYSLSNDLEQMTKTFI